jgi:glycosyltransferase involved in cell wall biosynthesis
MKILQVNKFFFAEYGTEQYLFGLMDVLEQRGHTISHFSMQDPKNKPSNYASFFMPYIDVSRVRFGRKGLAALARMVYSLEARRRFARILDTTQPDLVHVHTIHHHISPSILSVAKKRGIPIVQTLHDYKLICPSYHFPLRNGKVCIDCRRGKWLHVLLHCAHKNSFAATLAVVIESAAHSITRIYERNVTRFIVPSRDMAERLVEHGIKPKQLSIVPHYVDLNTWQPASEPGTGVLFAGRLSPERGLDLVITCARALPEVPFYIAGDGPERVTLEAKVKLMGLKNVQVLGRLEHEQLRQLFRACRVVFFPTLTFETFGLTVLQAMASAKPVVASNLGGVRNLVEDGTTGYLFDPSHIGSAINQIRTLSTNAALAQRMGNAARKAAHEYSIDQHYAHLMSIYQSVLAQTQREQIEHLHRVAALKVRT